MEYMLDTVCLNSIEKYMNVVPIKGILLHRVSLDEREIDFIPHMKRTLEIIGDDRTLHMQVVAKELEGNDR